MSELENSLQLGIAAYKAGEKEKARLYLLKAVRENPESEQAWGWLSNTTSNNDERIHCLRRVVQINPANIAANKLLKELENNEWLKTGPPVKSPATVAGTSTPGASTGVPNHNVRTASGSDAIQNIIVALLVIMVLFWLGVGFLQSALSLTAPTDAEGFDLLCYGGWNIVFSVINGFVIMSVSKRKKSALQQLYLLSVSGFGLGTLQLFLSGAYLQACAIPLYIMLGILAYVNRETFVN